MDAETDCFGLFLGLSPRQGIALYVLVGAVYRVLRRFASTVYLDVLPGIIFLRL